MSKRAIGEIVKAMCLIVTAIVYFVLLSALISPGRASASLGTANDLLKHIDQPLAADELTADFIVEINASAVPIFANNSQLGFKDAPTEH